jgi:hypothetical protein
MQCHYCDRGAEITVERNDVRVGVCEEHFRAQMADLADSEWLDDIEEAFDIDRAE